MSPELFGQPTPYLDWAGSSLWVAFLLWLAGLLVSAWMNNRRG